MAKEWKTVTKEELESLYEEEKLNLIDIARIYGVCDASVSRKFKLFNIKTRTNYEQLREIGLNRAPKEWREVTKEKLYVLYVEKGLSTYELEKIFKVDATTVARKLTELGIKTKRYSDYVTNKDWIDLTAERLYQLYHNEGLNTYQIGELFNVSDVSVGKKLKKFNINTNRHSIKWQKVSKKELYDLYVGKWMSAAKIAQLYKVSADTVRNKLKELGIESRGLVGSKSSPEWYHITRDRLYQLYHEENKTAQKIGELYNVEQSSVLIKLRKLDITVKEGGTYAPKEWKTITREKLYHLYHDEGMTVYAIAEVYGVTDTTVSQKIRTMKIETRQGGIGDSMGSRTISKFLTNRGIEFKKERRFQDCKHIKRLPFDFAIYKGKRKLLALIEYDGEQHFKKYAQFKNTKEDKEEEFKKIRTRDIIKNKFCRDNNIPLLRIPYSVAYADIPGIIDNFLQAVREGLEGGVHWADKFK